MGSYLSVGMLKMMDEGPAVEETWIAFSSRASNQYDFLIYLFNHERCGGWAIVIIIFYFYLFMYFFFMFEISVPQTI